MTHIAITLQSLLSIRDMTQIRLAELTGIDRPSMSNYCNGKKRLTSGRLVQIALHLTETQGERAELIISYLKDELRSLSALGVGESDILIRPVRGEGGEGLVVPLRLRPVFTALLSGVTDPEASDLRDLLGSLAHLISAQGAATAEAALDAVDTEIVRAAAEKRAANPPPAASDRKEQTSPPS